MNRRCSRRRPREVAADHRTAATSTGQATAVVTVPNACSFAAGRESSRSRFGSNLRVQGCGSKRSKRGPLLPPSLAVNPLPSTLIPSAGTSCCKSCSSNRRSPNSLAQLFSRPDRKIRSCRQISELWVDQGLIGTDVSADLGVERRYPVTNGSLLFWPAALRRAKIGTERCENCWPYS